MRQCARAPGKAAVIVGSRRFQGQELRETGFRSYFRELAPEFTVLDAVVSSESDEATREACLRLIDVHPDLVGVYVAGGGMAGGFAALRELPPASRPVLVCPALTPDTRAGLSEGMVAAAVCEPVDRLAERLVELVVMALEDRAPRMPHQLILPIELYMPENL